MKTKPAPSRRAVTRPSGHTSISTVRDVGGIYAFTVPQVVLLAGPNGAGKTSAAPFLLRDTIRIDTFVNADVIAQGLAGFRPESAAVEAGRILLHRIDELAGDRKHFAFESTLAGRAIHTHLSRMAEAGYDVHIFYLWLPSADLAVRRVRQRVALGGHDVPEPVIRRRFRRSLINFDRLIRPMATTWRLYDGSHFVASPTFIASGTATGALAIRDVPKWHRFLAQLEATA